MEEIRLDLVVSERGLLPKRRPNGLYQVQSAARPPKNANVGVYPIG